MEPKRSTLDAALDGYRELAQLLAGSRQPELPDSTVTMAQMRVLMRGVEYGEARDIYYSAHMPYTWGLLSSIARMDQDRKERLKPIRGQPPSLINVPEGCPFNPRCPYVMDICRRERPELLPSNGHHASACHLPLSEKERILKEEVLVHS